MTAEEIAKKYFPCQCGEIYLSRNLTAPDCPYHAFDWESAMQEIAELAFIAGTDYLNERFFASFNTKCIYPDKEKFIKQLFPEPDYDLPMNWEPNYNGESAEERRENQAKEQKLK